MKHGHFKLKNPISNFAIDKIWNTIIFNRKNYDKKFFSISKNQIIGIDQRLAKEYNLEVLEQRINPKIAKKEATAAKQKKIEKIIDSLNAQIVVAQLTRNHKKVVFKHNQKVRLYNFLKIKHNLNIQ